MDVHLRAMVELKELLSAERIKKKVEEAASLLNRDYAGRELTLVVILKGALCLAADLMRHLTIPFTLETVRASSYGVGGMLSGPLKLFGLEHLQLEGRDLLLLDDIYDTGQTLDQVEALLLEKKPHSLKRMTLLCKKGARRPPDYSLFEIGNDFVVGYGLDYKEHYRGLPAIYTIQIS